MIKTNRSLKSNMPTTENIAMRLLLGVGFLLLLVCIGAMTYGIAYVLLHNFFVITRVTIGILVIGFLVYKVGKFAEKLLER